MSSVTCAECWHFTRDTIGFGDGIGSCAPMETWLDKFPKRRPRPDVYDKNYKALGNRAFWPHVERVCSKYETLVVLDQPISESRKREYF